MRVYIFTFKRKVGKRNCKPYYSYVGMAKNADKIRIKLKDIGLYNDYQPFLFAEATLFEWFVLAFPIFNRISKSDWRIKP